MPIVNSICAATTDDEAWDFILKHRDAFFWTDDEDHVQKWNRQFGSVPGWNPISEEWRDESLWLTCRNKTVRVPLRSDRIDRWINIHAIAQLVSDDFVFLFCKDSGHSSDQACLALPAMEWGTLESEFDSEVIARRFLRINKDFNVFLDDAFPVATEPLGRSDPALTNWIGGSSYQPAKLDYVIVSEGAGHVLNDKLDLLFRRYLKPGLVGVSTDAVLEMRWVDRNLLPETVAPLVGRQVVRVVDSTSNGFLIIEQVGVAAAWRTDDRNFLEESELVSHRRWWEFWKNS